MRKITSLLMLFCAFAGATSASAQAWHPTQRAATLEAGKQYMLYNTAKDNENRSGFFFNNGSGLGFSGVQLSPSTFVTADNRYLWTLEATGNECEYHMKSVPSETYVGPAGATNNTEAKNLYIQPWMTSQAPKGGANSVNTDGSVTENGSITAENRVFTICGTGLTSNGQSAANGDCWNGTSSGWTKWGASHPYAFYEVEEVRTAEEMAAYNAIKDKLNDAAPLQSACGLVTASGKYTSNAKASQEGSYEALLDNEYTTYFHSAYNNNIGAYHYLQAELPATTSSIRFYFKKRSQNNNNRPTSIKVEGSVDGTTFTEVTTISDGLPTNANVLDYWSAPITSETAYKYYRFTVLSTNNGGLDAVDGHPFFTFSEFYVWPGDNAIVNEVLAARETINSLSLGDENFMAVVNDCNASYTKFENATKTVTINYEYNGQVFHTAETTAFQGETAFFTSDITRYGLTCEEETKSITVGADNNVVTFTYIRNSDVIPFETTDGITNAFPEDTKWYYLTVRNRYCRYDAESGNVKLPDSRGELLYKDLFAFSGDPANGYKIYSYVAGATKVIGGNNVTTDALVSLMEDNDDTQRYFFECNDGHYVFRKAGTSLGYLNDIHSKTALGYWVDGGAKADGGSTFVFEAVDADEIAQIPLNEAKDPYQDVYDRIYAMVIGTGAGKYTSTADADAYAAVREAAIEAWRGTDTDAITQALEAAAAILEDNTFEFNMPTAGFYRIKSKNANFENMRGKYVQNTGTEGHEVTASNGVNSVFYIDDDNKILSFASGQYLNDYQTQAAVGEEGKVWTIEENTTVLASYALKADGQSNWLSDWTNANKTTNGQKDGSAAWAIEPVEWLPIPMNTEIGYATLYSPVALGRFYNSQERVKVYTAKVNDAKTAVELTECTEGVPANTGVILEYKAGVHTDGCVYLPLATAEINGKTSDMTGINTYAATLVQEDGYVLSKPADKMIGLYKAEKNQQKDAANDSWKNNGFKAYLPASLVSNNAPALTFDFGTETGIENIVNAARNSGAIYDLSGRRVKAATKGIFIINGKKVIK